MLSAFRPQLIVDCHTYPMLLMKGGNSALQRTPCTLATTSSSLPSWLVSYVSLHTAPSFNTWYFTPSSCVSCQHMQELDLADGYLKHFAELKAGVLVCFPLLPYGVERFCWLMSSADCFCILCSFSALTRFFLVILVVHLSTFWRWTNASAW